MRAVLATVALALTISGCGGGSTTSVPRAPQTVTSSAPPATAPQPHRHRASTKPHYGTTRVWLRDGYGHLLTNRIGPMLPPSAIQHLPPHGIAVWLGTQPFAEVLLKIDGSVIGHLIGNHLPGIPHLGAGWVGPSTGMGCSTPSARYRVCSYEKSSWIIDTHTGAHLGTNWLTGAVGFNSGWFRSMIASPDGRTLLVSWSGDCEMPEAVLVPTDGAPARSAEGGSSALSALESEPIGWMPDGRALVSFPQPACGDSVPEPGVYTVAPPPYPPDPQLVYAYKNSEGGAGMW